MHPHRPCRVSRGKAGDIPGRGRGVATGGGDSKEGDTSPQKNRSSGLWGPEVDLPISSGWGLLCRWGFQEAQPGDPPQCASHCTCCCASHSPAGVAAGMKAALAGPGLPSKAGVSARPSVVVTRAVYKSCYVHRQGTETTTTAWTLAFAL